jgi:hypothetical protein
MNSEHNLLTKTWAVYDHHGKDTRLTCFLAGEVCTSFVLS